MDEIIKEIATFLNEKVAINNRLCKITYYSAKYL